MGGRSRAYLLARFGYVSPRALRRHANSFDTDPALCLSAIRSLTDDEITGALDVLTERDRR